jgi:hypothetical protein
MDNWHDMLPFYKVKLSFPNSTWCLNVSISWSIQQQLYFARTKMICEKVYPNVLAIITSMRKEKPLQQLELK